jgi:type I restriction enzyme S subunit
MQTYPRMKDSGVEWIGEIPSAWSITKLKYVYIQSNAGEVIDKGYWGAGHQLLYTCQQTPMTSDYEEFPERKRTGEADLLLTRNATPYIFVPENGSIYSNVVQRIAVQRDYDRRFVRYALICGVQVLVAYGDTIPSYSMTVWDNIFFPNPPKRIQEAIVSYLDSACADIDTAIAEAKASIDEYKLLKQSVIIQAVTKGLDPNVPMKDSGVEWIGEIPEHWGIAKIASLYSLRNDRVSDKEYPPLSVTMHGILPQLGTAAKTDDGDNRRLVRIGDFVINSRSDRRGSCGISPYDGSVSLINTAMTPRRKMNAGYFNWLFHTSQFADEFYKWGHGIVDDLWTTRWQEMKKILVPVPQLPDQEHIRAYLDSTCADIDAMISEKQSTIADLESYKKSLIYEVVTGKRKVV